jgi:hypothetical protein
MPEDKFRPLGQRLLSAGIAPRHVRRLVMELASHYESLVEEEMARGQPIELARSVARNRLGTDDEIARKVLEEPGLRSWGARWPFTICGLAPLLGLAASAVAILAVLAAAFEVSNRSHTAWATDTSDIALWVRHGTEATGWLIMYGLPVLWSWALAQYAATRRLRRLWPLTGFVMTAALGAATNVSVIWPGPGVRGQLTGGLGFSTSWDAMTTFGTRWLINLILAIGVYYLVSQRPRLRHYA